MLHGVLNMPAELWDSSNPFDSMQRQSRYFEASKLIYQQADRIAELEKELIGLKDERLPNEQGTNRYGLDVAYFRKTINRELNRDLRSFMPSELARVLARLSVTADKQVIHEPEFSEAHNLEQHDKGVDSAIAELTICYRVALDEHKDIEDAEVLEGLIDRLQALKSQS
jgi:hypothetical protein